MNDTAETTKQDDTQRLGESASMPLLCADELEILDKNYELAKVMLGITDTHFYIGEIKDCTPTQFAKEANIVLGAYIAGKVSPLRFNDAQR